MKQTDFTKHPEYNKPLSSYERKWKKEVMSKNPNVSPEHIEHVIRLKRWK